MTFENDLITLKNPPPNRVGRVVDGNQEKHFTEAAIMLSYAMHLMDKYPELKNITIYPDGEHGKRFDIRGWLERRNFNLLEPQGRTSYGGRYENGSRSFSVKLTPGQGDVVAVMDKVKIVAECKGGIINTTHPGQKSRLRRGLYEAVGLLMSRPLEQEQQFAVVPKTNDTETVAERMIARCKKAGIGIVLVGSNGAIKSV